MADRIISNALGKYLSVFIKNWSKEALNLSFLRGEGELKNLEINDDVVQEVLNIPFLSVKKVHVNRLGCKMPSLTRLNNDPFVIWMDTMTIEIEEPTELRPFKTPLADFLKTMNTGSTKQSTPTAKKYGFIERLIDGLRIQITNVIVTVSTLGNHPGTRPGLWTPHSIQLSIHDLVIATTDQHWRLVDLKYSVPKYESNKPLIALHKKGTMRNLSVKLIHPILETVTLLENVSATTFITQTKMAVGNRIVNLNVDIVLNEVKLTLNQTELAHLIRMVTGLMAATRRQDLVVPHLEWMKKRMRAAKGASSTVSTPSLSSERTNTNTTKISSSAINRFITKQQDEEGSDDDLSDSDAFSEVGEMASTSTNEFNTRATITLIINEAKATLRNGPYSYLLEILGTHLTLISPEDSITDKHVEVSVPFIQLRETSDVVAQPKTEQQFQFTNIIGPQFTHPLYNDYVKSPIPSPVLYTIDLPLWPEFKGPHQLEGMPPPIPRKRFDSYMDSTFNLAFKRKFFEVGKEMVRLRFIFAPQTLDFVLESRVSPIQIMLHVKKLITLTEYILESFPDLSIEPPEQDRLVLPNWDSIVKKTKQMIDVEEVTGVLDEENSMALSFLIEIRNPAILLPSNSNVSDFDGVSELLKLSTREILITSDPQIKRPEWATGGLFVERAFPAIGDVDFVQHKQLWELLPTKLQFKLTELVLDLMPSYTSAPQKIMEPLSLTVDLGINDDTLSDAHAGLPKLVLMTRLEHLSFTINQNQCILLMELFKTYLDDPPDISTALIQKTKQFTDQNMEIMQNRRQSNPVQLVAVETQLLPTLTVLRLDKISLTICSSSKEIESLFDAHSEFGTPLSRAIISNSEVMIETHKPTRVLVAKARIGAASLMSPPPASLEVPYDAMSITLAHRSMAHLSKHIFEGNNEATEPMIQVRYEHPLHMALRNNNKSGECNYPLNPLLNVKADGVHVGLNVNSLFKVIKFLESRENVFELSPLEIARRTAKRTFKYIKTKIESHKESALQKPVVIPSLPTIPKIQTPLSQKGVKSGKKKYFKNSPRLGESGTINLPLTEEANGTTEATNEKTVEQPVEQEQLSETATPTENVEPLVTTSENDLPLLQVDDKVEVKPSKDLFDFLEQEGESDTVSEKKSVENEETGPIDTINEAAEPDTHTDESTDTASHHDTLSVSEPPVSDVSVTPTTPLGGYGATPLTPTTLRKKKKSKIKRQLEKMMNEDTNPLRSTADKKIYPLLWNLQITAVEVIVVQEGMDGEECFGVEIANLESLHNPVTRAVQETTQSRENLAHEVMCNLSRSTPQQYDTMNNDFEMSVELEQLHFYTQTTEKHPISDRVDMRAIINSDYNKPIHYEKGVRLEIGQDDKWVFSTTPVFYNVINFIVRGQIDQLKQHASLLKFLKKPSTEDLQEHFEKLANELMDSQRAITRALLCHESLSTVLDRLQEDIHEKDEALHSAISDKMRLTEMLAETMDVGSPNKNYNPMGSSSQKSDQFVLMEGFCYFIDTAADGWKKMYCAHLGSSISVYPDKLKHNEIYDPTNDEKRYYSFPLLITTSFYKAYAPVSLEDTKPKLMIVMSNDKEKVYLSAENPTQMDDWIRIIEDTIDTLKKERENQLKQEEDFKKQQREAMERQKKIQEQQEKGKEEPSEMPTETATGVSIEYRVLKVETFEMSTQTEHNQESTINEVRTLQTQFKLLKTSMLNARHEQEVLQKHMAELIKYVLILREEDKNRMVGVQEKLRKEAERTIEEDRLRTENSRMEIEVRKRDKQIALLQEQVRKANDNTLRTQEEARVLSDNLKDHIGRISTDLSRQTSETKRLERELQIYRRGSHQRKSSLTMSQTGGLVQIDSNEEAQEIQNQLQKIIAELSERLVEKEEELERLKGGNVGTLTTTPPRKNTSDKPTPPKPSSLPPVPSHLVQQQDGEHHDDHHDFDVHRRGSKIRPLPNIGTPSIPPKPVNLPPPPVPLRIPSNNDLIQWETSNNTPNTLTPNTLANTELKGKIQAGLANFKKFGKDLVENIKDQRNIGGV